MDDGDNVRPLRPDMEVLPEPRTRAEGTRAQPVTRARRRTRVLELRAAGLTEQQIADQMGLTQQGVSAIITRALKKWAEESGEKVEEIRAMKLFELDQLKRAVWAKAIQGDLKAIREAVRIIQVQAKIAGAEAPVKVEHRTTEDIGIDPREVERLEQVWLESGNAEDAIPDAEVVDAPSQ